jgi:hypothetical protein
MGNHTKFKTPVLQDMKPVSLEYNTDAARLLRLEILCSTLKSCIGFLLQILMVTELVNQFLILYESRINYIFKRACDWAV